MCSNRIAHPVRILAACAVLFSLGLTANAQLRSEGLDDLNLWGVNFLEKDETALSDQSWSASDGETLLALTRRARTRKLSPVEQDLMRRLVLSSADAPEGEAADALLAERVRLMFQIGEASAAAQILPSLKTAPLELENEEIAIDLQLAIGQTEAACLSGAGAGKTGAFWAKLSAVCFALTDNFEEAELAMELAGAQGANDEWLTRAIFAASGALEVKPEARFDSGMSLAISAKAGLEPSISTIANSRLDLAAAIARQDTFTPSMRVQAAGVAAEAGLLSGEEHRALYRALVQSEGFSPRTSLEVALHTNFKSRSDAGAKARTIRAALQAARGNAARYSAVARLLLPDLLAIKPSAQTERMAIDFVSASLAAGAPEAAVQWIEGSPDTDESLFTRIWTAGVLALSGADISGAQTPEQLKEAFSSRQVEAIASGLVANSKTQKQKQAATRLFVLWHAVGIELPADARQMLTRPEASDAAGRTQVSPFLLASIGAAAEQGAGAEAVLRLIEVTDGDASRLPTMAAASLVAALRALGQEDAARMLALNATGYWRRSL